MAYEYLATVGPRWMHSEFCIVSDRPVQLTQDAQRRPHADKGPFCAWRDGTALYAYHGTRVPQWIMEHPERITVAAIHAEPNAEVRRVMLSMYGMDRYLNDCNATLLDASDYGRLYRCPDVPGQREPLVLLRLVNSTPEGRYEGGIYCPVLTQGQSHTGCSLCGDTGWEVPPTFHPDLRDGQPYYKEYVFAVPPTVTRAREGVAWQFRMEERDYAPQVQS
jgi:hypothetical protein